MNLINSTKYNYTFIKLFANYKNALIKRSRKELKQTTNDKKPRMFKFKIHTATVNNIRV